MMTSASNYIPNIPDNEKKRIVVAGGGFAGLKLIRKLIGKNYQIVLLDKNNFHQFQPLLYQVATAGLEPSATSFPVRKVLQKQPDLHFRIAELKSIDPEKQEVTSTTGKLRYDYLVLAMGARMNFYGQDDIMKHALWMKSASDAIWIRNTILENFEEALLKTDEKEIEKFINISIVGAGPTGVELAGALAEMKRYIFPKDYPELDLSKMRIALYEMAPKVLPPMSSFASEKAKKALEKLGVEVHLDTGVKSYDGVTIKLSDDTTMETKTLIWAAGVKGTPVEGIPDDLITKGNRIMVDEFNRVKGFDDIFALGDLASMETDDYPKGHPQLAQPAIQQAKQLARNIVRMDEGKKPEPFKYVDKGSLATIGRNKAVADLPWAKFSGFPAWVLWSFVHLFTIMGVKNKLIIFVNWLWNYMNYDQSLRLLIRPKNPENAEVD